MVRAEIGTTLRVGVRAGDILLARSGRKDSVLAI